MAVYFKLAIDDPGPKGVLFLFLLFCRSSSSSIKKLFSFLTHSVVRCSMLPHWLLLTARLHTASTSWRRRIAVTATP